MGHRGTIVKTKEISKYDVTLKSQHAQPAIHGRPQGRARGALASPWPAENSVFLDFLGK